MKLKLNRALRASLMACYALAAPIATTVSTGAMVAGVSLTLLTPQAQASVYTWLGGSDVYIHTNGNWSGSISSYTATWAGTATNIMAFGSDSITSTTTSQFTTLSIAGVISENNDSIDTFYLMSDSNANRSMNLRATTSTDAESDGRLVEGATNFIVEHDFSMGTTSVRWSIITLGAAMNIDVSQDAIFSINAYTLATSGYATTISGGGTVDLNLSTAVTGAGDWTVSGDTTLLLSSNANSLLTVAGSVTLDGGTISTTSGTSISSKIVVTGTGNVLNTTTEGGSLTLNGTISYTDVLDLSFASSLDVDGSVITFGSDLIFDFNGVSAAGEYTILTGLSSETVLSSAIITSGIDGYYVSDWTINSDGELVMTLAQSTGMAWTGEDDNTWSGANWADNSGVSSTYSQDSEVTFSNTESMSIDVDMDVSTISLSFDGSGDTTLTASGEYSISNSGALSVSDGNVSIASDISTLSINVTGASLSFSKDLTCVGSVSIGAGASLSLEETASVTGSLGTVTIDAAATGMSSKVAFTASALTVNGGTNDFAGDVTVTGNAALGGGSSTFGGVTNITGTLSVSNGSTSASFDGATTVGAATFSNGTSTFNDSLTVTGALTASGGTINLNGVSNAASLALSNSSIITLGDDASLTVSGVFSSTGGTINGDMSVGSMTSSGTTTINGAVTSSGSLSVGTSGTLTFDGGESSFYSLLMTGNNATISLTNGASVSFANNTSTGYYGNHLTWVLDAGTSATFSSALLMRGGCDWVLSAGDNGGGTMNYSGGLYMATNTTAGTTLTVDNGVSLYIDTVFDLCYTATTDIAVYVNGLVSSSVALTNTGTSGGTLEVSSTGTLVLEKGLMASGNASITANVSGILALGNQDDSTDYSGAIAVTMSSGSTLTDDGSATTVYTSLSYAEGATINLAGSATGSLTIASDIDVSSLNLNVSGAVTLAGDTNVSSITVAEGANLSISGDYTFTAESTIINNGAVTLLEGVSLDISALLTETEDGTYSITLIDCGESGTVDNTGLSMSSIFGADSLIGLNNVSFSDGVLTYSIGGEVITWSAGGELSLGTGETIDGTDYSDSIPVLLNGESVTLKLISDVASTSLTIDGGITVTLSSEGEYVLNSSDVIIASGSTLEAAVDLLGDDVSFANSSSASTLALDLGGETLENFTNIDGFTGELVISNGTFFANGWGTMEPVMDFSSLTVEAGATFQLYNASLNSDGSDAYNCAIITLLGGDSVDDAATFSANGSTSTGEFVLSGYTVLTADGTFNLNGALSNADASDVLIKTGEGTLTVNGDFGYTGDLQVEGGTLAIAGTFSGDLGDITMADGTTLSFTNAASAASVSTTGAATLTASAGLDLGGYTITGSSIALSASTVLDGTNLANVTLAGLSVDSGAAVNFAGSVGVTTTYVDMESANWTVAAGANVDFGDNTSLAQVKFTGTSTISLGDGASLSFDETIWVNGDFTLTRTEGSDLSSVATVEVERFFSTFNDTGSTVTIGEGVKMIVNGTETGGTGAWGGAFSVVGGSGTTVYYISGELESNAALHAWDGTAELNVKSTGTLTLNQGLYMTANTGDSMTLNIEGVLAVADAAATTDCSGVATVNMLNGSTLKATSEVTNVYTTLSYATDATVTFDGNGNSLVIQSDIDAASVTANIVGSVSLNGTTTVATANVASGASLIIGGSLTGDIALAGGSLTVAGSLSNDITVSADSSIASSTSALELNSAISYAGDYSLDLGSSSVTLGEDFSLDLSSITLDMDSSYTVFTGLSSDLSLDTDWDVSLGTYDTDGYSVTWTYEGNELVLSFSAVSSEPSEGDWNDGSYEIPTEDDTTGSGLTINTDDTDAGSTPTISTGGVTGDEGTTTTGNIAITGDTDVTITGENDLASTGSIDFNGNATVEIDTGISADGGLNVNSGNVTLTEDGSITGTDVTLAAGSKVAAGNITLGDVNATDSTTISLGETGELGYSVVSGVSVSDTVLQVSKAPSITRSTVDYTIHGTINDSTLTDTKIILDASTNSIMNGVTLNGDCSFDVGTGATLTATDTTLNLASSDTNFSTSLVGVTDANLTLTVDTFSGFSNAGSVTIDGTLVLNLELTSAEYEAFVNWVTGDSEYNLVLTMEGVTSYADGSLLVITFTEENADSNYYYVWGDFVTTGATGGSLVVELSQFNVIPEPSTATLSLLALAGLLARRRRSRTV